MRARYAGTCQTCGRRFPIGTEIRYADGVATHETCPAEQQRAFYAEYTANTAGLMPKVGATIERDDGNWRVVRVEYIGSRHLNGRYGGWGTSLMRYRFVCEKVVAQGRRAQ